MESAEETPDVLWRKHSSRDSIETDGADSNIWDDSALIEAYDKAVSSFKNELDIENPKQSDTEVTKKTKRKEKNRKKMINTNEKKSVGRKQNGMIEKKWQVGDQCLAMFYEDGLLYNATIISIDTKARQCTVMYDYYKNEAEVDLKDLFTNTDLEWQSDSQHSENRSNRNSTRHGGRKGTKSLEFAGGWRIGDPCLVPEQNGAFRKGIITAFPNQTTCEVTYLHNGERKKVTLGDLHVFQNSAGHRGVKETDEREDFPFSAPGNFGLPAGMPNFLEFQASMMMPHLNQQNPFSHPLHELYSDRTRMPPPPPPPPFMSMDDVPVDEDALSSMLMSWYMVGYHTGYYQGVQHRRSKKKVSANSHVDSTTLSSTSHSSKSPKR